MRFENQSCIRELVKAEHTWSCTLLTLFFGKKNREEMWMSANLGVFFFCTAEALLYEVMWFILQVTDST